MYFRTFFFLLFILSSIIFFFSSYNSTTTLQWCGSLCTGSFGLQHIQLTAMNTALLSLILLIGTNYYAEKELKREKERLANDRMVIDEIHAELEALKK